MKRLQRNSEYPTKGFAFDTIGKGWAEGSCFMHNVVVVRVSYN
jgi:hypothetical protein